MKKTLSLLLALLMALSCFAGVGMEALAYADGWKYESDYVWDDDDESYVYKSGYRYYYDDEYLEGWQWINGSRYFFDYDSGFNARNCYREDDRDEYYLRSDGKMSVSAGWQRIYDDDAEGYYWYYFNSNCIGVTGWRYINGYWYYLNEGDDPWMYANGAAWIDGESYVFSASGAMLSNGWKYVNGDWYYLNRSGVAAKGWRYINGNWYYFNTGDDPYMYSSGAWYVDGTIYGFNASGSLVGSGWRKFDGSWYYFNSGGVAATGWRYISGSWYYFDSDGAMVNTQMVKINGVIYSFHSSGALATGWVKYNGYWYYSTTNGVARGWKKVGSDWYYFKPLANGAVQSMATGWWRIDGEYYYFNSSGSMRTAALTQGGKTYYFYSSGACWNYY